MIPAAPTQRFVMWISLPTGTPSTSLQPRPTERIDEARMTFFASLIHLSFILIRSYALHSHARLSA